MILEKINGVFMAETKIVSWHNTHVYKIREQCSPIVVENLEPERLRQDIEPWLTALFQSEHLSLLMGAGISSAAHYLAAGKTGAGMLPIPFSVFKEQIKIASRDSAVKTGRGTVNIEDQVRVVNELINGLEIYTNSSVLGSKKLSKQLSRLKQELKNGMNLFAESVLECEKKVTQIIPNWGYQRLEELMKESDKGKLSDFDREYLEKYKDAVCLSAKESLGNDYQSALLEQAAEYIISFLVSFASRSATRERLNIFTTNYDRIVEYGAELAGIRLIDRFVGSINPIFRSSRMAVDMHYNPPGIRGEPRFLEGVAYFTKLHGSLDWVMRENVVRRIALPYGADSIEKYTNPEDTLMIYPNAAKDRETAEYPYVELFRDLAASVCRPNSTLVLYGYSFGDQHINRVIEDMLTIPSTHLVVISWSDEGDRIKSFFERLKRSSQISLLIGNHFGDLKILVDYYLPKPAIDKTTIKMAELLKNRGIVKNKNESGDSLL